MSLALMDPQDPKFHHLLCVCDHALVPCSGDGGVQGGQWGLAGGGGPMGGTLVLAGTQ